MSRIAIMRREGDAHDQLNTIGAQYPRMLYKSTTEEQRQIQTDKNAKCGETYLVVNKFDGLLCDTLVAESASHAEQLASDGWDVSPKAAHGLDAGIVADATAKDAEIAALKAQLAEMAAPKERKAKVPKAVAEAEPEPVSDDM